MRVILSPVVCTQPFYKVLVDVRDRPCQTTYVAQCNLERLLPSDVESSGKQAANRGASGAAAPSATALGGEDPGAGAEAAAAAAEEAGGAGRMDTQGVAVAAARQRAAAAVVRGELPVLHPLLGFSFRSWDGQAFVLNEYQAHRFPGDACRAD
eukprot:352225-Chlamydomonas_euryale.AAC.3